MIACEITLGIIDGVSAGVACFMLPYTQIYTHAYIVFHHLTSRIHTVCVAGLAVFQTVGGDCQLWLLLGFFNLCQVLFVFTLCVCRVSMCVRMRVFCDVCCVCFLVYIYSRLCLNLTQDIYGF
jgi:hypothetical protein